jgi:hypothetical protein
MYADLSPLFRKSESQMDVEQGDGWVREVAGMPRGLYMPGLLSIITPTDESAEELDGRSQSEESETEIDHQ